MLIVKLFPYALWPKANGSHRAARPHRLNQFSAWLDRTDGLRPARAILPREADLTLPSPAHRTVHRRQFLRQDGIESIPAARSGPDLVQPRPVAADSSLPTGGFFSNHDHAPCAESRARTRSSLASIPSDAQSLLAVASRRARSKVSTYKWECPGPVSLYEGIVVRIKSKERGEVV